MSAFSSKGTTIWMSKAGVTPTVIVPTAISTAKPAEVTATAVTGIANGDVVKMTNTGMSELDGKVFTVGAVTGTTFDLVGSDTTNATGTLGVAPAATVYTATDMIKLCLADFTINNEEPGAVSVATFCDPSASLPSATQAAGTVTVGGYVNDKDADYLEMILATDDGQERVLEVIFPSHGALLAPVTFGAMGFEVPIEGAPAWSATGVLGSKFVHVF